MDRQPQNPWRMLTTLLMDQQKRRGAHLHQRPGVMGWQAVDIPRGAAKPFSPERPDTATVGVGAPEISRLRIRGDEPGHAGRVDLLACRPAHLARGMRIVLGDGVDAHARMLPLGLGPANGHVSL
jgi:hypothetical protein